MVFGTWYITVDLPGINLSHKRIWNNKGRKRRVLPRVKGGRGEGRTRRGNVLNGTLQGVLILISDLTLISQNPP